MSDIFSRAGNDFQGSFAADAARLAFAGGGGAVLGVGLLTQNLNVQYSQQITRLYEIGTNYTFLVQGRAQGQLSIGRILGPRQVSTAFYAKFGNVCNAATNNINFSADAGCGTGGGSRGAFTFSLKNCVITSIGLSVQASDMILNEQLALMFVSLELGAA